MKGTDKFLSEVEDTLVVGYQKSLAQLYLTIAGINAITVYNMLLAQTHSQRVCDINKLLKLSGLDINEFEAAVISLEKCELLNTYCRKAEDFYLFVLHSPLSVNKFFSHDVYGHLLLDKVGQKVYESTMACLVNQPIEREYFEDVTHKFDETLTAGWSESENKVFNLLKYENPNNEKYIFDIKDFMRGLEETLMPSVLRTDDNLNTIASLGTTFAIRADDMTKYLLKAIDYKTATLDVKALRNSCIAARKIDETELEDEYQSSPILFLYKRRGNVPVAKSDKEFLERCLQEYKLKREVVNALIEVTLNNKDGRFVVKYAEKLASEWASNGIDTKEKAFAESEGGLRSEAKDKKKKVYTLDEMDVEEIPIEELRARMFRKG